MAKPGDPYYEFSQEALAASIQEMIDDVKANTGATDEQINAALAISARKFMDINCFELEDRRGS